MNQLHLARGELHGLVLLILGEDARERGHVCHIGAIAATQHVEGGSELSTIRATSNKDPSHLSGVHARSTFSSTDTDSKSGTRSFASEPVTLAQRRAVVLLHRRKSVDVPYR